MEQSYHFISTSLNISSAKEKKINWGGLIVWVFFFLLLHGRTNILTTEASRKRMVLKSVYISVFKRKQMIGYQLGYAMLHLIVARYEQ